jgi:hypothetical protein
MKNENMTRDIVYKQLDELLPKDTKVVIKSGSLKVTAISIRIGNDICFTLLDGSEVVACIQESFFLAARCKRRRILPHKCTLTIAFKDGSQFLEIDAAVDPNRLDGLYL